MVLSSGTGLLYPQGLCLGTITSFAKNDVDYAITLKPLIDLEKLEYCFLISAADLQQTRAASQPVSEVYVTADSSVGTASENKIMPNVESSNLQSALPEISALPVLVSALPADQLEVQTPEPEPLD